MANRFYLWASTDFESTSNWSATRGGSGGEAAPASNDVVYIETDIPRSFAETNLSKASVDLNALYIRGPVSFPALLTIAVSGTSGAVCDIAGARKVRLAAGTNGIDKLVARSTLEGHGVSLEGGTTVQCNVGRGAVMEIQGSAVVTNLSSDGKTTAQAGTAFTTANGGAGTLETSRSIGTGHFGGPIVVTTRDSAAVSTKVTMFQGSKLHHLSHGTIADIETMAGSEATAKGSPYQSFTVTAAKKHEGSRLFEDSPAASLPTTIDTQGETSA
jgi:hypothetical protein